MKKYKITKKGIRRIGPRALCDFFVLGCRIGPGPRVLCASPPHMPTCMPYEEEEEEEEE